MSLLTPPAAPLVRPTLGANPTAQDALDYAAKLSAFESAPPALDLPFEIRELAYKGIRSLVSDFLDNDGHEFSPEGRARRPHSISELDHAKIAFYSRFFRKEYVAEYFDVSVPTVYLDHKRESIVCWF